jgi:hypothetical protein
MALVSSDRTEHPVPVPVPVPDAVLVGGAADPGLGRDVVEWEAHAAREAGMEPIQTRSGVGLGVSRRDDRDHVGGKRLVIDHALSYVV